MCGAPAWTEPACWPEKILFFVGILKATAKKRRIQRRRQIRNPVYRSKDPDPDLNVTEPDKKKRDRPLVEWCVVRLLGLGQLVGQRVQGQVQVFLLARSNLNK